MKATTKQLFNHVCNQMEKLSKNEIGVEEAKAQANLTKQANNLLKYELDKAIAISKYENITIKDIED